MICYGTNVIILKFQTRLVILDERIHCSYPYFLK
jgi:hypothetical protein